MSEESKNNFHCYFKAFSETPFGDILDVELYINNLYIYEIKD